METRYILQNVTACSGWFRVRGELRRYVVEPIAVFGVVHVVTDGQLTDQVVVGIPPEQLGISGNDYEQLLDVAGYVSAEEIVHGPDGLRVTPSAEGRLYWV